MSTRLISKNRSHGLRVKMTEKLDPRKYGPTLKKEHLGTHALFPLTLAMQHYTPCFMHGEMLAIEHRESGKFKTPTKTVDYPTLHITSFYSYALKYFKIYSRRVLGIKVLSRVSQSALWMIEQEYGGFDEYVMTCPLITDHVALMYRKRVREMFEQKKDELRSEACDVLNGYGREYIEKLKGYEWKMDNLMLKECDEILKGESKVKIPPRMGLISK